MKVLILLIASMLMSCEAFATIPAKASDGSSLGVFRSLKCSAEVSCDDDSGNLLMGVSGLQTRVLATATTITAAQCGSTFYNGGAVQMELPEASTVLGCRLTFITANASNFDINPDDADQILVETNAVGDAIRNATLGNSIVIEAISASQWAPVGTIGTWADID